MVISSSLAPWLAVVVNGAFHKWRKPDFRDFESLPPRQYQIHATFLPLVSTGFLSEIGTKLRDWAVRQAGTSCYSWAALSSNGSKTRYMATLKVDFLFFNRKVQSTGIFHVIKLTLELNC